MPRFKLHHLLILAGLVAALSFQSCLTIVRFLAPSSAHAGEQITVSVRVKSNIQSQDETPTIQYFFSTDRFLDPEDRFLFKETYQLDADALYGDFSASFAFPSNFNSGTYFLLALAQQSANGRGIYENGENILFRRIEMIGNDDDSSDLYLSDVHLSDPVFNYYLAGNYYSGNTLRVYASLHNRGEQPSGAQRLRYYLSQAAAYSPTDPALILLDEYSIDPQASNERLELRHDLTIPSVTNYGTYYLHTVIDYLDQVAERNEDNNIATRALELSERREDHYVQNFQVPGLVITDESFAVSFQEGITGRLHPYATQYGLFLSEDENFSADDLLLQSGSHSTVATINSRFVTKSIAIPSTISTGSYFVIAVSNPWSLFPEYDRTNNEQALRTFVVNYQGGNLSGDDLCDAVVSAVESDSETDATLMDVREIDERAKTPAAALLLYPNPARDRINLKLSLEQDNNTLLGELISATGKRLHYWSASEIPAGQWNKTLDVSMLPAGVYYLRLSSKNLQETRKFIVK